MKYVLLLLTLIFLASIFGVKEVKAMSYLPTYNSFPPSGLSICPDLSGCGGSTCYNSEAVGVTDCGAGCSGGNVWSQYNYTGCYSLDAFSCQLYFTFNSNSCSTADKCVTSDGPYLRAGFCSCTTGGIYKTCCNPYGGVAGSACVQVSNDGIDPPYEGVCPAGSYSVIGDASSCPQIATNTPLPAATATPTPTIVTSGTCSGICGGSSNPPGSCTAPGGGTGTWQWVGGEPPYTSTCGSTGSTPYCYKCVASGTAPTPTTAYTGSLDPLCPNVDNDGRPNQCVAPGTCSFGFSYKGSSQADNACTTFVTLDPLCPNTDIDGRPNQCTNSCSPGYIQKGGAADAACQSAGAGSKCCHNYAPKQCCHQNPPPTPTPVSCGFGICGFGQTCSSCPIGCGSCPPPTPRPTATPTIIPLPTATPTPSTFSISGSVFVDNNSNGSIDVGEPKYLGGQAVISIPGKGTRTSDALGNYSYTFLPAGSYTVSLSTLPPGYTLTSTSPLVSSVGPNQANVNFGIKLVPPPVCASGLSPSSASVDPGVSVTLFVTSCTDVKPTPTTFPPPPYTWNPDTSGITPVPTISGQTDKATSSTVTWTAPSCPTAGNTYTPRVTVVGYGGQNSYSSSIKVPATYTITINVRKVTDAITCASTSGTPFKDESNKGATVNLSTSTGTSLGSPTTDPNTGTATFTCKLAGDYLASVSAPSGYALIGTQLDSDPASFPGSSPTAISPPSSTTVTFCIASITPWFQTDIGDVRFNNLQNLVPKDKQASTDTLYPGIFYSSDNSAKFGDGTSSSKSWIVENEYKYNTKTQNRNGSMSYDFYRAKAKQQGVDIQPIDDEIFDINSLTESGVYEVKGLKDGGTGNIIINSQANISGKHIVLLAEGNVTINQNIKVGNGGLLVIAAKGKLTVSPSVTNLDGYYAAQRDIVLESVDPNVCKTAGTKDIPLLVNGALIANSLKPFATTGLGTIQNKRSLCVDNLTTPSLKVISRPDFLLQLTDFYKTTYTKWSEVNP